MIEGATNSVHRFVLYPSTRIRVLKLGRMSKCGHDSHCSLSFDSHQSTETPFLRSNRGQLSYVLYPSTRIRVLKLNTPFSGCVLYPMLVLYPSTRIRVLKPTLPHRMQHLQHVLYPSTRIRVLKRESIRMVMLTNTVLYPSTRIRVLKLL